MNLKFGGEIKGKLQRNKHLLHAEISFSIHGEQLGGFANWKR